MFMTCEWVGMADLGSPEVDRSRLQLFDVRSTRTKIRSEAHKPRQLETNKSGNRSGPRTRRVCVKSLWEPSLAGSCAVRSRTYFQGSLPGERGKLSFSSTRVRTSGGRS